MDLARARHLLLGVSLEDFVAERDRLVRELGAAGEKADAAELKRLRRPPATLWALNQVARQQPAVLAAFFAVSERMVAAHDAAARGQAPGPAFREASADYRRALAATVAVIQEHLLAAGHAADATTARRLERTLLALPFAAPEVQAAARAGALPTELERADPFDAARLAVTPGGAGGASGRDAAPPAAAPPPAPPEPTADAKAVLAAAAAARREALVAAAEVAARAAERALQTATRARAEAAEAHTHLDAALRTLRDAEAAVAGARRRAAEARALAAALDDRAGEARRAAEAAAEGATRARTAAASAGV